MLLISALTTVFWLLNTSGLVILNWIAGPSPQVLSPPFKFGSLIQKSSFVLFPAWGWGRQRQRDCGQEKQGGGSQATAGLPCQG